MTLTRCPVCVHSQRPAIDQALTAGAPTERQLGDAYGLNWNALVRHRKQQHHRPTPIRTEA
ncbi:hypothetical protein [Nakamurella leprariae]|uniref:Uncharacterized protein n=1 Tax=Nakamurella leprariae TaxID=2803911 RepID=A0A939BV18_9ACTN|nr:hypothetical protein [Nakamurella leprariae]MBM9466088.1 hypothetical protein [Nakamurella leprariae]